MQRTKKGNRKEGGTQPGKEQKLRQMSKHLWKKKTKQLPNECPNTDVISKSYQFLLYTEMALG